MGERSYVASCRKCGGTVGWVADMPDVTNGTAEAVACWLLDGAVVDAVTSHDEVQRRLDHECDCESTGPVTFHQSDTACPRCDRVPWDEKRKNECRCGARYIADRALVIYSVREVPRKPATAANTGPAAVGGADQVPRQRPVLLSTRRSR